MDDEYFDDDGLPECPVFDVPCPACGCESSLIQMDEKLIAKNKTKFVLKCIKCHVNFRGRR